MSRVSLNSGAEGKRAFSLYGVNQDDRVAASTHFAAADMQEAVARARSQIDRFHKVELWEGCDCVFAAARPPGAPPRRRAWTI